MSSEAASAETILSVLRRLGHDSEREGAEREGPEHERVTLGELVARLDERGHALVLLLLTAPNLTPGPSMPGFSTVLAVPLVIVALEMALGRRTLRLPRLLANLTIRRRRIANFIIKLEPFLARTERVLKPRGPDVTTEARCRAIGAACVVLGLVLALPIPVFCLVPATALLVIALGLLARDGAAVICGLGIGVIACGLLVGLIVAARHLLPLS